MKNKKMMLVILVIVIIGLASVLIPKLMKQQDKVKTDDVKIGVLQYVTHPALDEIYAGIKQGLSDEGYSKAKINFYNAQADQSKVTTMSGQLADQKNNVLIGIATPSVQGLANATSDIPVIMGAVSDPVGAKLIKNVKKPEGNVTGVSDKFPVDKEVELIKTLTPDVKKIGILYSSSEDNSKSQVAAFKKTATEKGYDVSEYAVSSTNDITTMVNVALSKVDAIYVPVDNTIASAFPTVIELSNAAKKPVFPSVDTMVTQGGLAAVTINQHDLGVATGKMAAQVLKGKKVSELPVAFYNMTTPVVNREAAKTLGITIPEKFKEAVAVKK
ncbi:peptide ABC transporter substrate-binding protein [Lactococcus piscium]|uniref:Peptide ABC transporter substrate-binding protein n=1 Tax=Pseudolactococcus paracarnosus TaxID=2749962 RepID=A0A7L4WCA4_9LACT|nr:tryptophan ABC transporter substrate-binding protein [Lactococcus paracarnosus]MCJ1994489.1 peptide ABC transporter substrate-binding protein [Lactococcus paracarnosus]QDJ27839.1 peptide ABC transporter substrate-binding protein [Lactococcus paracarnosus]SPC35807.1 ABC transporter substrate-binding protein [Lactococcus piscium]